MRIALTPTATNSQQQSVIIEIPSDGLDIYDVADLLRAALLAWSFGPASVDEILPPS